MWIVRVALDRPYTFIVLALLILIVSPVVIARTPTDIFPAIETGQIKALWLIATNPMTSMPNIPRIKKTLQNLEFLVVQDAYADVGQIAH